MRLGAKIARGVAGTTATVTQLDASNLVEKVSVGWEPVTVAIEGRETFLHGTRFRQQDTIGTSPFLSSV